MSGQHNYPVHPVAELFPMMTAEAFAALKADIAEHGQREDIVLWDGKLIDGRNRLKACLELGVEPEFCEMDAEADPVPRIISLNLHRRHLTESQRATIASELATMKRGKPSKDNVEISTITESQAAEMLSVSRDQVAKAKAVKRNAAPEVVELVKSGEVTINAAKNFAKAVPDKKEQAAVAAKGVAEVKKVAAVATAKKSASVARKTAGKTAAQPSRPKPTTKMRAIERMAHDAALKAIKSTLRPCLVIESWLRQATREEVSAVWSEADHLLADMTAEARS